MSEKEWNGVLKEERIYNDYEYPHISIVIPTLNNCERISTTLDSILGQFYPYYNIIIVDGGSTDRTLEVIKNYRDDRISIYSVSGYQLYEMFNKGIAQAEGEYMSFMLPGDFYIHPESLQQIMQFALQNDKPHFVYAGTLVRDGRTDPYIYYNELTRKKLKIGEQPSSIETCFFLTDTLRELGKFDTDFTQRGSYDLICRLFLANKYRHESLKRVLVDRDLQAQTITILFQHFKETLRVIFGYFGLMATLKWLIIQTDLKKMYHMWWRKVKIAFTGT